MGHQSQDVAALSQFEFVQVTIAVILGLGLTDLLRNLGDQFRHRNKIEIYWLQLLASCLLLFVILMYLWNFWSASQVDWTLPLFILQVASAVALALSAQFIKVDWTSSKTAKAQYFNNRLATFVSWSLAPFFSGIFSVLTNDGIYFLPRIGVFILLVSLAMVNKPIYHALVITALIFTLAIGLAIGQFKLA